MRFRSRTAETPITTWIAIGAVILIGGSVLGFWSLSPKGITNVGTGTSPSGNLVSVLKTLQITCIDPLVGSNCGGVTDTLYQGTSSVQLESATASGSGVWTTGSTYQTGTSLTLKVSGNSKATEFLPFTVPAMDPNSAISSTTNAITVYAVTLGTYKITVAGSTGTTFTSGLTYGFGQFTGNSVVITVSVSETAANAGYKTSYDVSNLIWNGAVVQMDDGAGASSSTQYATITGMPRNIVSGSTHYYPVVCPDGLSGSGVTSTGTFKVASGSQSAGTADSVCSGSLTEQTIGTQVFGGSASFSFTAAVGSLTGTNTETLSFKFYTYYDVNYFALNLNGGTNAAQQGSTFTVLFHA